MLACCSELLISVELVWLSKVHRMKQDVVAVWWTEDMYVGEEKPHGTNNILAFKFCSCK